MLTATPRNVFSSNFTLRSEDEPLAELNRSSLLEKGTIEVANTTYRVYREGLLSGAFVLETNGRVCARAEKPSAMTRRIVIDAEDIQLELRPRSTLSRSFQLLKGGVVVGTLSPSGFLSRRMNVELSETLSLPVKAFVVWLTVLLWNRDDSGG
jgi:hypothetical protein